MEYKQIKGIEVLRIGTPMPSGRVYADTPETRKALAEFAARVERGAATAEFGMPDVSGLVEDNVFRRQASISTIRTCAKIDRIENINDVIYIDVTPSGNMAKDLMEHLTGDLRPVFGLRSFARPNDEGALHFDIHHITTFDYIGTIEQQFEGKQTSTETVQHDIDAQMVAAVQLPDGSGVAFDSFPLPKDHWIYHSAGDGSGQPPMAMRMGTASPFRPMFEKAVRAAAQYAVRASTACGRDMDFDPDAMVNNMLVGLFGYFTEDGLAGDALDAFEEHPRFFAERITLPKAHIKDIAMANGFTEKPQGEGPDDLHPYVYDFANAMSMASMQQFIGQLGTAAFLVDVELPKTAAKLDITE